MKVFLAYRDRDLDPAAEPPANASELIHDLGLDIIVAGMAAGDGFLADVATSTILAGLDDPDAIRYRQRVLADCLRHPDVIRELYALAVEAIEREKRVWGYSARYPSTLLHRSVAVLEQFVDMLERLRATARAHADDFGSEGLTRLVREIVAELDDDYLRTVREQLRILAFHDGIDLSAAPGTGARGTGYVLRRRVRKRGWRQRIGLPEPGTFVYEVPQRDEAGAQALRELEGRGIAIAAEALARSTDHILSFFQQLRVELGFYVGCLNLHARLTATGEPTCLPEPSPIGRPTLVARDLIDTSLSLYIDGRVVGNDVDADGIPLIVITGANRGGKSTFLRSLGQAQLMMQAGMFVAASSFRADVRRATWTHFKREEDATLESGKLEEELVRMSWVVERSGPDDLILLNESFASTNEREGSEIARQIVRALLEHGIKVGYVTHMYDLASGFRAERGSAARFLRAERLADGRRTFRLVEADPLPTSHGEDIYRRVFGDEPAAQAGAATEPAAPAGAATEPEGAALGAIGDGAARQSSERRAVLGQGRRVRDGDARPERQPADKR